MYIGIYAADFVHAVVWAWTKSSANVRDIYGSITRDGLGYRN